MEQISPENLLKLQNFIKEIESNREDSVEEEFFSITPQLIINFLEENNYVEINMDSEDLDCIELEFNKENPNYKPSEGGNTYFNILMRINSLNFIVSLQEGSYFY